MKKLLVSLLASSVMLVACGQKTQTEAEEQEKQEQVADAQQTGEVANKSANDQSSQENKDKEKSVEDVTPSPSEEPGDESETVNELEQWLPKTPNVERIYTGEGSEFAEFTTYPQFIHEDTVQIKHQNPGITTYSIYEYREDSIVEIFAHHGSLMRDDFANTAQTSDTEGEEIVLKTPIEVGTQWEDREGQTVEITATDLELAAPNGTVPGIEVTTTTIDQDGHEGKIHRYYGKDIGLVKEVTELSSDAEMTVTSTLTEYKPDTVEKIPFTLYALDYETLDQAIEIETELELKTNDPIRLALTDKLKEELDSEVTNLLPNDATINFMYLDDNNVGHVDFSEELATNMQAGASGESEILQRIVDTIANLYHAEAVNLSLDGGAYDKGGHVHIDKDQLLYPTHGPMAQ
ncbi:GerMN domain-containing protein [Dolosigranulum pigrum]|uniref:GerMN domain-containing protein n=1 Tax=Dolosigranulum pigrum TaxID=29394 RepID=UPI001AD86298|nr:GerMN domain-containing protein [Dolosigranulum pigrum]QTJ36376.1 GerMN domain-containing protein [Dolosigranulum pigrum]